MSWDPKTYLDFEDERTRPAAELLARIAHKAPEHVIDLGCGPRGIVDLLSAHVGPQGAVVGVERSEHFVASARKFVADRKLANVEIGDADTVLVKPAPSGSPPGRNTSIK